LHHKPAALFVTEMERPHGRGFGRLTVRGFHITEDGLATRASFGAGQMRSSFQPISGYANATTWLVSAGRRLARQERGTRRARPITVDNGYSR
jgi:hypothetical protein